MVSPSVTGPRFYLATERDVQQTSWEDAQFERGRMSLTVADGSVGSVWRDQIIPFFDEWDTDRDGYRDVTENEAEPPSNPFDPTSIPPSEEPDVFWTFLANGQQLPVNTAGSNPALRVRGFDYPSVQLHSAPAESKLPRPTVFRDYSTQFFIVDPATNFNELYSIALYNYSKVYPNAEDVGEMEADLVRGVYQVQYTNKFNPFLREGISATHNSIPNGNFTLGVYKRPTWLVRDVQHFETVDGQLELKDNDWDNGRLVFDPDLHTKFRWDDLVNDGLAHAALDEMFVTIEDEGGNQIWPDPGVAPAGVNLSLVNPEVTIFPVGLLGPAVVPINIPPASRNGFLVLRYVRSVGSNAQGELNTVRLRVPIEMKRSYASYRLIRWPGDDGIDNNISGPGADPDGDGVPNFVEFENGLDPTSPNSFVDHDNDPLTVGVLVRDAFWLDIDTDGDTIPDWLENRIGFDLNSADSDGDGLSDSLEDRDNDGLYDYLEYRGIPAIPGEDPIDPATVVIRTDLAQSDTDGDGLQDGFEYFVTGTNPSAADADADGLNDLEELQAGSDPLVADTDGDSLLDGEEVNLFGTSPILDDTDGDGILDADEDTDRDHLSNRVERDIATQTGIAYNPLLEDSDGNGVTDDAEDADGDGLNNLQEVLLFGYDPGLADSDGDGTSDYDEDFDGDGLSNGDELFKYSYDPTRDDTFNDGIMDGNRDPDGDGLGILAELNLTLTDPLNPDSDGDLVLDGLEDPDNDLLVNSDEVNVRGTNPRSSDTDLDGIQDGVEVFVTLSDPTLRDTDGNGTTDYYEDSDGDFLPDGYEVNIYSGNLETLIVNGQSAFSGPDSDGDGLLDIHEQLLTGTDFGNPDTDGDGILDGAEDFDGDGLTNAQELPAFGQITAGNELYLGGTNPMISDSDGDGLSDGDEVNIYLTNPLDIDSDDDGFRDNVEIAALRDPNNNADFPVDQLITQPRVRVFPTAAGTPPGGVGFLVEAERLAASAPVGGVRYQYVFQGSTNLNNWVNLPAAEWTFANVAPTDTGDPTATYTGPGNLPTIQYFRIIATAHSITP
jgi:hypothetical protein